MTLGQAIFQIGVLLLMMGLILSALEKWDSLYPSPKDQKIYGVIAITGAIFTFVGIVTWGS